MPEIHICSLKLVDSLAQEIKPSHILSVLGGISPFPETPPGVDPANHLKLTLADIVTPEEGMTAPAPGHVAEIIAFGRRWAKQSGGQRPLLVHCFAGISRSTASALMIACALRPKHSEVRFAYAIRCASASAQPNSLLVSHADDALKRNGRMIAAAAAIGEGDFSRQGPAFKLHLDL